MSNQKIFIGENSFKTHSNNVKGEYVQLDKEYFYKINNYDKMDSFFMSIVSGSDFWMFVSSTGGLTTGRKNPDNALFPYYTDDIIHDSGEKTGNKTILKIKIEDKTYLWEPFSNNYKGIYNINRNLYKNIPGNKILFEEINNDLGLIFSYCWLTSEEYGIVKNSSLTNTAKKKVEIEILDGIQNILPNGVDQQFQNAFSTLADGYKKCELISDLGIGVYSLSSIPSDKAEPSESLLATTVWSTEREVKNYLLSSTQLNDFRSGKSIKNENDVKGRRGSYFINCEFVLGENEEKEWLIVSEINQNSSDLARLIHILKEEKDLSNKVLSDVDKGTEDLIKIVASSDGLQLTKDKLGTSRHFANTLFNVMRGGIFGDSYTIDKNDFISFVKKTNARVYEKHQTFLSKLDDQLEYSKLQFSVVKLNDNEFTKLVYEYMPLSFSRRHGDPSRPWNRFSIDIKDEKNNRLLNYQGNWRDIFQNWEALAESFPGYIESMIAKFLNGSTADGYNPYRLTRDGFDWEIPEPDQPWANIGYWGDHQIIYLLKLLELSYSHDASKLNDLMNMEIFSYVNVPYRIKEYAELLKDPHNTVDFDKELHKKIETLESEIGSDARFTQNLSGELYQVNLVEKLLSPLLSKLSNFIPGGGIWMNTQRPEWNDANNALVGYGISMVTLYYLRRYVKFLIELFSAQTDSNAQLSKEVYDFFEEIHNHLSVNKDLLNSGITDVDRKKILDGLGNAGSNFRNKIYKNGFANKKVEAGFESILNFLNTSLEYIDETIKENRREDGLYHAYNLMSLEGDKVRVINLYEMLEGQVAVLSSGYLATTDSIDLLDSLRKSTLYREDQNSYILYPNRDLPKFIEKNIIPKELFKKSDLFVELIQLGDTNVVSQDIEGNYHFNGSIRNAGILKSKLESAKVNNLIDYTADQLATALEIYEAVFNHKYFTGRSGTFYKYEGLGSIYWHMVSKLVLAVQETFYKAVANDASEDKLNTLRNLYYEIKEGIGVHKSPVKYGAFPTDPYSHTPSFAGVQQPGMTGQVKEDFISRFRELGVSVNNREIDFNSLLINTDEFLEEEQTFEYYDVTGNKLSIQIPSNSLAFTYCQVPIIYQKSNENKVVVTKGNEKSELHSLSLNGEDSRSIFNRTGGITRIDVYLK